MSTRPPQRPRGPGLPRVPLLGRWGLLIGAAILGLFVALGGPSALRGGGSGDIPGVDRDLAGLPGFAAGTFPADAPGGPALVPWLSERAAADWRDRFRRAGRPWDAAPVAPAPARLTEADTRPALVLAAGTALATHVQDLLGIPGRIEIARRDDPSLEAGLRTRQAQLIACLAGAWGRTLVPADALVAAAPADRRDWVRTGAELGAPSACDTLSGG